MSARERWFERRFAFDLPNARFPSIVERLRGTPARLEERLHGVPAGLVTRRDGDRWSIQENAGHLGDLEPLWIGRVEDLRAGRTELTVADLTNAKTHAANHNARALDEVLREFRSLRTRFVALLEGADTALLERHALHPRLKTPMRLIDMAQFTAEHDDHHLACITELLG